MRYFAFMDRPDHLALIRKIAEGSSGLKALSFTAPPDPEEIDVLGITGDDRVVVSAENPDMFTGVMERLSSMNEPPAIILLAEHEGDSPAAEHPNVSSVDLSEQAFHRLNREWRMIETRRMAHHLADLLENAGQIAILLQDDPDPDAIASGLAVQALLGRNRATAPLVTFGEVTRNENVAMTRILKTQVRTVTAAELDKFDRVVMVDVQPPYFPKDSVKRVDAVIDHHPYPATYDAPFKDLNTFYGATSTMLFEYLSAYGAKISKRIATALLYGIMTDTMRLERGATRRDFEAFSALWPLADKDMLADMARPRLNSDELKIFVRAIRNRRLMGDFLFIWLGGINREDIVARLADFSLQIGESLFSITCGVYKSDLVVSFRSLDPERDAGEIARMIFSKWGSAGGHPSMAKAVIPVKTFRRAFGIKTMKETGARLAMVFKDKLL